MLKNIVWISGLFGTVHLWSLCSVCVDPIIQYEKWLCSPFQHPFFRFVVGSNRVIFMLRDGSYAWEVKDFLTLQDRCEDVTVEGQVFPGKAANKASKDKEQNETKKKKDKSAAKLVNKSKQELWGHWYLQGLWSRRKPRAQVDAWTRDCTLRRTTKPSCPDHFRHYVQICNSSFHYRVKSVMPICCSYIIYSQKVLI